jgi:parafibromin
MSSSSIFKGRAEERKTARDWWEAATKPREIRNESTWKSPRSPPLQGQTGIPAFELNSPEHLPNSPLCAKNPKLASGGSGLCVYHGRRRSVGLKTLKRISTDRTDD